MNFASMNSRNRRALTIGAVIAIPGLLVPLVVKPYFHALTTVREQTADEHDRMVKERRAIAVLPTLPAVRAHASQRLTGEINRLFQSTDNLVATGDLARYVADAAQNNGLNLQQSETHPSSPVASGVEALQVDVRAEGDLNGILHFLHQLEAGGKLVRIGTLSITGGQNPQLEERPGRGRVEEEDQGGDEDHEESQGQKQGQGQGQQGMAPEVSTSFSTVDPGQGQGQQTIQWSQPQAPTPHGIRVVPSLQQGQGQQGGGFDLGTMLSNMMKQVRQKTTNVSDTMSDHQGRRRMQRQARVADLPKNPKVLSLSASIYGYHLTGVPWSSVSTQGKSAPSPFLRPAHTFASLDAMVDHDLFSATRSRPSAPYQVTQSGGERDGQEAQTQRSKRFDLVGGAGLHVVGTVISPNGHSFAMIKGQDNTPPQIVHVGENFAGYTVTEVRAGEVVFTTPHGYRVEKQLQEPGVSR